jgi:DNA-binding CsgD family transcriptional regulator
MVEEMEALLQMLSPMSKNKSMVESRIHLLSIREREILMDIATGATTREIAMKRHNSEATVKSHLTSIYRKLDVRNRVEAIAALHQN